MRIVLYVRRWYSLFIFKTNDRSSNTSPDVPNKKPRLVERVIATPQPDRQLIADRHSMPETETITLPHETRRNSDNGDTLPHLGVASPMERSSLASNGLYTSKLKNAIEIKSPPPHLPPGDTMAIAATTGAS